MEEEEGEKCQICGTNYLAVWKAPNSLWLKVTGYEESSGLMCPQCFDALAREKGIGLYWVCAESEFPNGAGSAGSAASD